MTELKTKVGYMEHMVRKDRWTREQLKLAFYLYCQLPFGKLHSRNAEIMELAQLIGRTPSAVAMKLVNFASLDPSITSTGRTGLGNAGSLDYGQCATASPAATNGSPRVLPM